MKPSDPRWSLTSLPEAPKDLLSCEGWVFVLPDSDHGPASGRKVRVIPLIPVFVPSKLCRPVAAISLRAGAMIGASVPEAAINEDRELCSREDDVGVDRSTLGRNSNWVVHSKAETQGKEGRPNSPLGPGIAPSIALHRGAHRGVGSLRRSRQPFDPLNLAGARNGARCPTDSSRSLRSSISRIRLEPSST